MIDALLECFNVAVKHRASAAAAHSMPGAMNIQPFLGGFFAATNPIAHASVENFRAATGDRAQTVFAQKLKRFWDRHLEDALREMSNLDCRESFDVRIGIESAQSTKQLEVPFFFQGGMQTADHVYLRDPEWERFRHGLNDLAGCVLKGMGIAFFGGERAKLTGEDADIRIVDVTIVNVGGDVAVLSLSHDVREHAERVQIV